MEFKDAFVRYLSFERRYSAHTIKSYSIDLTQFEKFLNSLGNNTKVTQIDDRVIRDWVILLLKEKISARSVNRKLTTLKTFFRFLQREGEIEKNPTDKVFSPKTDKNLPVFIEERQMDTLLDDIEFPSNYEGTRDKLIIQLFYNTGMRLSELIGLTDSSINHYDCTIKVIGKRNKERLIPITKELDNDIQLFIQIRNHSISRSENDKSFILTEKGTKLYPKLVYRIVSRYLNQITTIQKKSPHILRHTFATHMLNHGADLNAIKELLGHANLTATQVYTHNTFEKLKKTYKQTHPRG